VKVVILFGGVLLHKSAARVLLLLALKGPQDLRVRCARLMIDKHSPSPLGRRIPAAAHLPIPAAEVAT
jgi:hypothetical protein